MPTTTINPGDNERSEHSTINMERATRDTKEAFDAAGELVLDIQDNSVFISRLQERGIPYDDTLFEFWETVQSVAEDTLVDSPETKEMNQVMRIVAAAPDAGIKQFILKDDSYLDYPTKREYVRTTSEFNSLVRDYVSDNLDVPYATMAKLLTEAASRGIDPAFSGEVAENMEVILKGIRTELGFEQKMTAANIPFRRATTDEDLKGIDYVLKGDISIDVKSSLNEFLKSGADATSTKSYFVKSGRAILYPYDAPADYENGTFRMTDHALELKTPQLVKDIAGIKKSLA